MPTVIDLFAGAGGLSLGAIRAGFNVAAAVELDSHALNSHITNFPHTIHIQRDILSLSGKELLSLSGIEKNQLVGVIGGPPCQGFSSIGHGNVNDSRNLLFIKFFELIEQLQPTFFVAENVPGIMNDKYSKIRTDAFKHIQNYTLLSPIRVSASEYGAPTIRTRIFFIGYRNDALIKPFTVEDIENMKVSLSERTCVRSALEGLPANIHFSAKSSGERKIEEAFSISNTTYTQSPFFYQRVIGFRPQHIGNCQYCDSFIQKHIVNGCLPTKHSAKVRKRYASIRANCSPSPCSACRARALTRSEICKVKSRWILPYFACWNRT